MSNLVLSLVLAATMAAPAAAPAAPAGSPPAGEAPSPAAQMPPAGEALPPAAQTPPADALLAALGPGPLTALAAEVLERNPDLARARARAAAAAVRAPQVAALPDPMAGLTLFLLPPETRTGPQRLMANLSQRLPWFGKLRLREQAAMLEAAAVAAEVEETRLGLITETRRLYHELAFLDAWEVVVHGERDTLARYEELARSRYASGMGTSQPVVKIQAEITNIDSRLLEIADRRATLTASLNALRDRPADTAVAVEPPASAGEVEVGLDALRDAAERRPELAAADARIEAAQRRVELADKELKPDVTFGLTYTVVENRDDEAGRRNPPQGNGEDILGISGSVNLPIWHQRLEAGVAEALAGESEAGQMRRAAVAAIERSLGELQQRLPLTWDRLELLRDVLTVQAEESLASAEAAYAAGAAGALDLLDAERTLLQVRVAAARAEADYAIALAQLEGAIATPLSALAAPSMAGAAASPRGERP